MVLSSSAWWRSDVQTRSLASICNLLPCARSDLLGQTLVHSQTMAMYTYVGLECLGLDNTGTARNTRLVV